MDFSKDVKFEFLFSNIESNELNLTLNLMMINYNLIGKESHCRNEN